MLISDGSSDVCSSDLEVWRQIGDAARIVVGDGRIAVRQIAPALVRAPGLWMHALERRGADDVDPPVVAILEAHNLDPRHQRVSEDRKRSRLTHSHSRATGSPACACQQIQSLTTIT